jgi:hypothetical protein
MFCQKLKRHVRTFCLNCVFARSSPRRVQNKTKQNKQQKVGQKKNKKIKEKNIFLANFAFFLNYLFIAFFGVPWHADLKNTPKKWTKIAPLFWRYVGENVRTCLGAPCPRGNERFMPI